MPIAFRSKSANGTTQYGLPVGWQVGDLHLLFIETANQEIAAAPTGWTQVPGSPQGTGAAVATDATRLTAFYRFAQAGDIENSSTFTISGTYNHNIGFVLGFSGVDPASPFDVTPAGDVAAVASLTATYPSVTTATAGAMIVFVTTHAADTSAQQTTAATFSTLESVNGPHFYQVTSGNGGGIYAFYGKKTAAGSTGTGTSTFVSAATQARMTIALRPADGAGGGGIVARPQVFVCT